MSRRLVVAAAFAAAVFALSFVSAAGAQEAVTNMQLDLAPVIARAMAVEPAVAPIAANQFATSLSSDMRTGSRISPLMTSLYATTAAMQMMDLRSSLTAFSAGATEANPIMSGIVKNKAAFFALKAGIAASTIWSAHGMAKRSKVRAVIMLAAVNSAYAMIVNHNYAVARSLR